MHSKGAKANTNSNFSIYRSRPPNVDSRINTHTQYLELDNGSMTIKHSNWSNKAIISKNRWKS